MKSKLKSMLVIAVMSPLWASCASSPGSAGDRAAMTPLVMGPPPIYALLGYRSELNLTSEQIAALDAIAAHAQEETDALLQELRDQRDGTRLRRPGAAELDGDDNPILDQLRTERQRISEAVAEVLDEEQEAAVCRLFARGRDSGTFDRRTDVSRAATDGTATPEAPRTWSWCGAEQEQRTA